MTSDGQEDNRQEATARSARDWPWAPDAAARRRHGPHVSHRPWRLLPARLCRRRRRRAGLRADRLRLQARLARKINSLRARRPRRRSPRHQDGDRRTYRRRHHHPRAPGPRQRHQRRATSTASTIGEAWFAWTENPKTISRTTCARRSRTSSSGSLAARNRLAAAGGEDTTARAIDELLAFELGGEDERLQRAGRHGDARRGQRRVDEQEVDEAVQGQGAKDGVKFLRPHDGVSSVARRRRTCASSRSGRRATPDLLESLDPEGERGVPSRHGRAARPAGYFAAAARAGESSGRPVGAVRAARTAVDVGQSVRRTREHADVLHGALRHGRVRTGSARAARTEARVERRSGAASTRTGSTRPSSSRST